MKPKSKKDECIGSRRRIEQNHREPKGYCVNYIETHSRRWLRHETLAQTERKPTETQQEKPFGTEQQRLRTVIYTTRRGRSRCKYPWLTGDDVQCRETMAETTEGGKTRMWIKMVEQEGWVCWWTNMGSKIAAEGRCLCEISKMFLLGQHRRTMEEINHLILFGNRRPQYAIDCVLASFLCQF